MVLHFSSYLHVQLDRGLRIGGGRKADAGGVLQGLRGNWIKGCCRSLSSTDILTTELWGVREGVDYSP